ncbi:NAD(P) transhydrogenase subunit alpha part 1 [bacterium MnTg02]|nr:NAD(P) transhydrogenase subunit alpha part 1 [bacterium MnTg02]
MVITTARIPGRPAPKLSSTAMVESMHPGAIIVDLAAERGGNCELTRPGEIVDHNGVRILGRLNLAGDLATNASSLYARNLYAFIETMIDKESGELSINWEDELVAGTLITRDNKIVHPALANEGT